MLTVKFQECEWDGEHLRSTLKDALRPRPYVMCVGEFQKLQEGYSNRVSGARRIKGYKVLCGYTKSRQTLHQLQI